jgi:type II secretory pathway predicted ATPase ExeA
VKHPAQVNERDRIQRAVTQRMSNRSYTYRARQRPAKMLQSVACLVGAGKTVALRAAVAALDPTRHQVIYIANPAFGTRGLHVTIVRALGAQPRYLKAELMAQATDLLAAETAERHRRVVVIRDEAHLLQPDQLEELRLLTNAEMDSASPFAGVLAGSPP